MKSESLWYLGSRRVELRPLVIADPIADDVVVALEACGICTWDIVAFRGDFGRYYTYPFSAGHEGVGRVVATGPRVRGVQKGQRVALREVDVGVPGGAQMARHAVRPERLVYPIPEGPLPVHHWIVEPAACIVNGTIHAGIQPGDRVALVGAGYMGLLFVQALGRTLASVVAAFDVDDARLALARELGANQSFNTSAGVPAELKAGFDVVIETAAVDASLSAAFTLARPGGIIENFAWHHHPHTFDLEDWHVNGWRILNIQPGMNPHFSELLPRTIALMAAGTLSNARLVTHTAPVERAAEIFTAAADRAGGYIKGVVTF
jgi:L-iditol 2-dehydrogenase